MRNKNIWIGIGLVAAIALVAVLAMVLPARIASPASDAASLRRMPPSALPPRSNPPPKLPPRRNLPPSLPRRRSLPSSLPPPRSLPPRPAATTAPPVRMNLTPGRRKRACYRDVPFRHNLHARTRGFLRSLRRRLIPPPSRPGCWLRRAASPISPFPLSRKANTPSSRRKRGPRTSFMSPRKALT